MSFDAPVTFLDDVLGGLRARPRTIPARWFYDRLGSELFELITRLPEYYPTRVETAILKRACPDIAARIAPGGAVVEFGSGSSTKTRILLRGLAPSVYVPIDISGDFVRATAAALSVEFPLLAVLPVEADFTATLALPDTRSNVARLGFFPGSTIGNFEPAQAVDLLRAFAASLGPDAMLVVGADRAKAPAMLLDAYDDSAGVTARFNLNLLGRINRELCGDLPLDAFRHLVRWNAGASRIEMHLEATRDIAFTIACEPFTMAAGETIHSENSHKYTPDAIRLLLRAGGWEPVEAWTDEAELFTVLLAEARPAGLTRTSI